MTANWANQTIWTGDCLDILRGMNSASVDLVYLDPPFNSKANYAAPIGSKAAGAAFKDTWALSDVDVEWINLIEAKHPALYRVLLAATTSSDKSYLAYMAARLLQMRHVLKPTGSLYLHCDPHMGHYLKLVLDAIFGRRNFRNEIVWYYRGAGIPRKDFARRHDTLLRYAEVGRCYFNPDPARQPYAEATVARFSNYIGNVRGDRDYGQQSLNPKGKHPDDVFTDIQPIAPSAKARTGYPTEKPISLLARIIDTSCPPKGVVLDPFCGCATACIAAEQLHRDWVGIDISPKAAELVRQRMHDELGLFYDGAHRTDIPTRTDLGKLPRYNSPENRKRLYGEQAGHCAGCNDHFEARHLEVDHIIARRKGGTDALDNLQLLCGNCNRIKGDRGMDYLRTKLQLVTA